MGTESSPTPGGAGEGVPIDRRLPLRRGDYAAVAAVAIRQSLPRRNQLGEQPGSLLSQPVVALDVSPASRLARDPLFPRGGRGIVFPGSAVSGVGGLGTLEGAGLEDRGPRGGTAGTGGRISLRAVDVLSRIRARFFFSLPHSPAP